MSNFAEELPQHIELYVNGKWKSYPLEVVLQVEKLRKLYVRQSLLDLETWRENTGRLLVQLEPCRELEAILDKIHFARTRLKQRRIWPRNA